MAQNVRVVFRAPVRQVERLDELIAAGEFLDRSSALFHALRLLLDRYPVKP